MVPGQKLKVFPQKLKYYLIDTGETRESRQQEFNKYFKNAFSIRQELPALFFDAYPDMEDQEELRANLEEVKKLVELTENLPPFPLEDAEVSENKITV